MYKKCHEAIKENAKNQNCKEFLNLIKIAEDMNLVFIYGYNRIFSATNKEPEKSIKYIEVIDLILLKKLNLKITLIKNSEDTIILYENNSNILKLNIKQNKLLNKRLQYVQQFSEILNKFNLDRLPIL